MKKLIELMFCAVIMGWFIDEEQVEKAFKGELIPETRVECVPSKVSSAVMEETVDLYQVRKCFNYEAWRVTEDVVRTKKRLSIWICPVCQKNRR